MYQIMLRSIGRFMIVLSIAIFIGTSLYLAMHYVVQPLADRINPEPVEDYSFSTTPEPIELPEFRELLRETLSVGKNGVVFVVMTILVVGIQKTDLKILRMKIQFQKDN